MEIVQFTGELQDENSLLYYLFLSCYKDRSLAAKTHFRGFPTVTASAWVHGVISSFLFDSLKLWSSFFIFYSFYLSAHQYSLRVDWHS